MGFVHLHLHTQFSLLDGAIRLKDLFTRSRELGFPAVAMTDHGNMFGAVKFFQAARKAAIKPIIGCEVYVAARGIDVREKNDKPHHLVLLARTNEGYANLCRLVSTGFLEGFYGKPRIDKELLGRHSAGLIGMTACLSGEVPRLIQAGDLEGAHRTVLEYRNLFEPDCFFLEIQKNGLPEQDLVNGELLNLSELTSIPLVATNDCHYLYRADAQAHEVLMCIQTSKKLEDQDRMRMQTDQFYIKSADEMYEQFKGLERALEETERIAARCNVEIPLGRVLLPRYPAPDGISSDDYLARMASQRLDAYLKERREAGDRLDEENYRKRLEYELSIITKMGFSDYYLIVWDFINHARSHGIPVGPGRGSGAGSLVAFSVGITRLDPIRFDLLFERFLNPERIDMPDFDIDFCQRKRDKMLEYVTSFYGKERVAQIATYSSLNPKQAIRDVGRVLGMSFAQTDKVTKLFPGGPPKDDITVASLRASDPKIAAIADSDDDHRRLFDIGSSLEKLNRQAGIHAAGVVIAKDPLIDTAPLWVGKNNEVVTQFAKEELEAVGLIKFDFLGLKTLTVIDDALELIRLNGKEAPDLEKLPLDRPEVYELVSSGHTGGIFQMESDGFRRLVRNLGPDRFEDIIAVLALYRPGPLGGGMVDTYVRRKRGRERIEYDHPLLEPVLRETYGVIVYQEQVMRIASEIAGFSMSKADELRKAMSKKKEDKMAKLKEQFIAGALARGHAPAFVNRLMDSLEQFGQYGFNKSHSAAYAHISYWTAYLKANFPVEFMAALTSLDKGNPAKMVSNLAECRRMKIPVGVPDINRSDMEFTVAGNEIVFGLSGIKNVGATAVKDILKERKKNGPFKSFSDFLARIDGRSVNKRIVEGLIQAGAFDRFGIARRDLLANLDQALLRAQADQRDRASGQTSLFGALSGGSRKRKETSDEAPAMAATVDFAATLDAATLRAEKEAIGFYLSAHPLDRYLGIIGPLTTQAISGLAEEQAGARVAIAGLVRAVSEKKLKSGRGTMARIELEDRYGMVNVIAFSDCYEPAAELIHSQDPILVKGTLVEQEFGADDEEAQRVVEVRADEIVSLVTEATSRTRAIELHLTVDERLDGLLQCTRRIVDSYSGTIPIRLTLDYPALGQVQIRAAGSLGITLTEDALHRLNSLLGRKNVRFLVQGRAADSR